MQIQKSFFMMVFQWKYHPENFTFCILRILELFARKVCEMLVCKQTQTIEYVKNNLLSKKYTNFTGE